MIHLSYNKNMDGIFLLFAEFLMHIHLKHVPFSLLEMGYQLWLFTIYFDNLVHNKQVLMR